MKFFYKTPLLMLFFVYAPAIGQNRLEDCRAVLKKDTLTINNSRIEEKWIWNEGNIIPYCIKNMTNGKALVTKTSSLSFMLPNESFRKNEDFSVKNKQKDSVNGIASLLEASIINRYTNIDVKEEYWIFPETPAISQNIYWKYHIHNLQAKANSSEKNSKNKPYSLHYESGLWLYICEYQLYGGKRELSPLGKA